MLRVSGSASDQTALDEMNPFPSLLKERTAWVPERERGRRGGLSSRSEWGRKRGKKREMGAGGGQHTHIWC